MSRWSGVAAILMIVLGIGLMAAAYLFGAAPWCADEVRCADPRFDWSPTVFVLGVVVAFSSALLYEIARGRRTGR